MAKSAYFFENLVFINFKSVSSVGVAAKFYHKSRIVFNWAALISSLVVTVMFSIAKEIFIYYVFLNKSYTTLYGSFSILMFLFLWIYASWFIFLNGLKLCRYLNNTSKSEF